MARALESPLVKNGKVDLSGLVTPKLLKSPECEFVIKTDEVWSKRKSSRQSQGCKQLQIKIETNSDNADSQTRSSIAVKPKPEPAEDHFSAYLAEQDQTLILPPESASEVVAREKGKSRPSPL